MVFDELTGVDAIEVCWRAYRFCPSANQSIIIIIIVYYAQRQHQVRIDKG